MNTTDQGAPATAEKVTAETAPAAKEKKVKAKKTKKASAKKAKANGGVPRESVANFIRARLKRGEEPAAIVKAAAKAFPKKSPTVGYVNWIREHAPKVSTKAA